MEIETYTLILSALLFAIGTAGVLLRRNANPVLLVFSFLSLCPMPPCLVMGVFVLIIGSVHARALEQTP